ncbi:hypothetical protein J5S49_04850 [Virgibacillus halodenitrificans]|uniref:hypothetical protein n=1 Tax=Virgibacillus halodenitrificans TaxID=1482 RepID=UPI001F1E02FC|nr:hypothetical protein [Virgibacillus halodenitrificans]MCG1027610.1 hypothetical protein [Virgibacillus halodenitrificans]MCJ0931522.1 hypothetical protein [Virgibacillus halodenitrificans]
MSKIGLSSLSTVEMQAALSLLKKASDYQFELNKTSFKRELIDRATPVVWFGENVPGNIVTIGTNPSSREFLGNDNKLLTGSKSRLYVREECVSLEEYKKDEKQLKKTIEYFRTYFYRSTVYRNWFGKKNGAKLEGFLNGMGGSLYKSNNYTPVVHTDFFPIPTKSQMGKIREKEQLLNSEFAKHFLVETLNFLAPSLIIVLGREHCKRFEAINSKEKIGEVKSVVDFPSAKYQLSTYSYLNVPVVGLHFKPSEQFIGLGGKSDINGRSYGEYGKKSSLRFIGKEIKINLESDNIG